jgi:hypothetical protein
VLERLFGSAESLRDFWHGLAPARRPAKRMRCTPVEAECAPTLGTPVEAGATAAVEAATDPRGTCARERFHREWCASHPVIKATPPELRVPLGIHGDGAGSTAGEKVFVMTWGGLAASKPSTLDSRIVFTCLRESEMAPNSNAPGCWAAIELIASAQARRRPGAQGATLRCQTSLCSGSSRCSPGASRLRGT